MSICTYPSRSQLTGNEGSAVVVLAALLEILLNVLENALCDRSGHLSLMTGVS